MAEVASPETLEAFAENQLKSLLDAQLTKVPDANILTGHTTDDAGVDEGMPVIIVTVQRDEEDIPGTGWWICSVEIEFDPRDLSDDAVDAACKEIETAIGDGGSDIETQITSGRLQCMTGSVFFDQDFEYEPTDGERTRCFMFTVSLGLNAP